MLKTSCAYMHVEIIPKAELAIKLGQDSKVGKASKHEVSGILWEQWSCYWGTISSLLPYSMD